MRMRVHFLRSCRVAVSYGGRLRRRREGTNLWLRLGLCGREPRLRALCAYFPLPLGKLDPTPTLFSLSLCYCRPCRLTLAQGFSALGPTAHSGWYTSDTGVYYAHTRDAGGDLRPLRRHEQSVSLKKSDLIWS